MTTTSTPPAAPPARYSGIKGALVYGLLIAGAGTLVALCGGLVIVWLTGSFEPAFRLFVRLSLFAVGGALATVVARSICGGTTDRLMAVRLVKGDVGAIAGWFAGILLIGFLTASHADAFALGQVAPQIEGEDLDGNQMRLTDYRGKVVVLDFWGNW